MVEGWEGEGEKTGSKKREIERTGLVDLMLFGLARKVKGRAAKRRMEGLPKTNFS